MNLLHVVPIAFYDTTVLETLRSDIEHVLQRKTIISDFKIDEKKAFDVSRLQYHSSLLLTSLLSVAPNDNSKLIGVTSYDLFVPVLTFVFGQAQLGNRAALFSTFRLHNEFYGLPPSKEIFQQRALKESLHELGHTFNLKHCFNVSCVMNASTYVEDIDVKPSRYCEQCMLKLNRFGKI